MTRLMRSQRFELDCATSSDALLMNIFCHPRVLSRKPLRALLGIGKFIRQIAPQAKCPIRRLFAQVDKFRVADDSELIARSPGPQCPNIRTAVCVGVRRKLRATAQRPDNGKTHSGYPRRFISAIQARAMR